MTYAVIVTILLFLALWFLVGVLTWISVNLWRSTPSTLDKIAMAPLTLIARLFGKTL